MKVGLRTVYLKTATYKKQNLSWQKEKGAEESNLSKMSLDKEMIISS